MDHSTSFDERETALWRAWIEVNHCLEVTTERLLHDSDLSCADYELLVPLADAEDGVVRARELRNAVGWDRSRLAHQLKRMEKRGLVEREDCPDDARATMVSITAEGRRAVEAAAPGYVSTVRTELFDKLEEGELDVLIGIYERLLKR